MIFTSDPNLNIVRDNLQVWYDPKFQTSYPSTGTDLSDISGNNYDGILTNGVTYNSANGGNLTLDGVDDYINLGDILNGVIAGVNPTWSVQFWVKFNTLNIDTTYVLLSKTPIVNQSRRQFLYMIRNLTAYSFGGFQIDCFNYNTMDVNNYRGIRTTGAGLTTGTIYNIAITFDGSVNTNNGLDRLNIYVNGAVQPKTLWNTAGALSNTWQSGSARIAIGASIDSSGNNPNFELPGTFYNFLLYGKTLSAAEVLHNYDQMKVRFGYNQTVEDYVVYLDASDSNSYSGSGSTWYDLSGNNYDANLINGPTYDSGNGGSIVFDGVNDYGDLGTISELTGIYDVSVCAWVKPISNAGSSSGTLINRYFNTNPNNGWSLSNSASGEPFNFSFGGRENSSAFLSCPTTNKYYYGDWHYVVGVKSGNLWSIYVDGVLENSLTLGSGTVAFLNNVTYLAATPQFPEPPNRNNNINLAQVQIYDRALAASEVLNNFNAEKAKYGL